MANFADILLALIDKIGEVFTDENGIIPTCRREMPQLVGDRDLLLRIRGARETEGVTNAAGRYSMQIRRYVDLIIRARQYSDVSMHDLQWLVDESNGILAIEVSLLNLLEMWHPIVAGTDDPQFLLIEPARIESSEEPLRDMVRPNPQGVSDPHFGTMALRMDLYYEAEITVSDGLL